MYNLRGGFLVRPLTIALALGAAGAFLSWLEETVPAMGAWVPKALFPSHADPQVAQVILAGIAASIMTVVSIVFAILLVPKIFYLLTLQKALNRCSPECRAMNPGMVWLMLIPLFHIVWQFFVVLNMAKSLDAEFQKRGIAEDRSPGQTIGLIMCIGNLICGPVGLVCWIVYWVKIAGYSSKLAAPPVAVAA